MTAPVPSRAAIDRAEPLCFDKPRKDVTIIIHATLDGFNFDVSYIGTMDGLPAAIARLRALGAEPQGNCATVAQLDKPRKPATHSTPAYDGNGDPVCPVHKKALQEGRYGLFCPSKAEGEHANAKGYCNIRFE